MTLSDVDAILASSYVRSANVQVVRADREPSTDGRAGGPNVAEGGLEHLYQQYRDGATIVLVFLHEHWPPLQALCRSLASQTSAAIQVNAYLTPPGAQGLDLHYDRHDVFVLQIAGSKCWRVFGAPTRLPLAEWPPRPLDPGEPLHDLVLRAGDVLYLPRGFVHSATAAESSSVHLTVGVKPITWASVVRGAVEAAFERDVSLRESLPLGFAASEEARAAVASRLGERLRATFDAIAVDEAVAAAYATARASRLPALDGHLEDLEAVRELGFSTPLRRRPDVDAVLQVGPDEACLEFHGKRVRVPAHAGPALRFVTETDAPFTAADLPGELDADASLVLLRRLLREGFVTVRLSGTNGR